MGGGQRSGFGCQLNGPPNASTPNLLKPRMHSPLDLPAKYASKGGFVRQAAARSFPLLELLHHVAQVFGREIGPPFGKKAKLCKGAFPEQKIGEALLAAGSNQ